MKSGYRFIFLVDEGLAQPISEKHFCSHHDLSPQGPLEFNLLNRLLEQEQQQNPAKMRPNKKPTQNKSTSFNVTLILPSQ